MIIANGSQVFLVGGHYADDVKGQFGTVLAHRNSARDGDSYIIEFGHPVGKIQVKSKFVRKDESLYSLEGKCCVAPAGIKIFEESDGEEYYKILSKCPGKQVLVTLIYEDFDTIVANVVYQGQYAIVKASDLKLAPKGAVLAA